MVQGRFSNPNLDPKVAEGLFREHLVQLQKRAVDGYIELLEEVITHRCMVPSAWLHIPIASFSLNPNRKNWTLQEYVMILRQPTGR